MNILFSPVGLTDPISNFRDGALLHICRYYDIDKIYIYLSKEVYEYHIHDNRYIFCLDKLGEQKGKKFEYELIIRDELTDVHKFDYFIDEFKKILSDIHNIYPDADIYLNVSSGTPGMKGALQSLSAFREFEYTPIQVATPVKKSNPHVEEKEDYRPAEMWECNDDNTMSENRCTISENINFLAQLKKMQLKELICQYDYKGAKILAESMNDILSCEFTELLDSAALRETLNYKNAIKVFKKYGFKLLDDERSSYSDAAEFILFLELKRKRGEYSDFLRAITPIFANLLEKILKEKCNFDIENYVALKNSIRKWSIPKLKASPKIKAILDEKYGEMKSGPVSSDHLITLLYKLCNDIDIINKCDTLRDVETNARNFAAHEIISITDEWIEKKSGMNAKGIILGLLFLLKTSGAKLSNDFLDSYDIMNKFIVSKLM